MDCFKKAIGKKAGRGGWKNNCGCCMHKKDRSRYRRLCRRRMKNSLKKEGIDG